MGATFGGTILAIEEITILFFQETGIATCWQYNALKTKDLGDFDDFGKAPTLLMSLLSLS